MGGFLDKPDTDKILENGDGNRLRYGVASMQGWRIKMEDKYDTKINLGKNLENWSYFAVFDGHTGDKASTYCAENLLTAILASENSFKNDIHQTIIDGFVRLDDKMRNLPEMTTGEDKSGTTAVCSFISDETIYIANCGDSRAILCRSGEPFLTTIDHRPRLSDEHRRIIKAGAHVKNGRINGRLAVSRALGDFPYKSVENVHPFEQPVSPEPEIFEIERNDALDEFLILASDGIWNVVSDIEICRYIRSRLLLTHQLEEIASQVLDMCLYMVRLLCLLTSKYTYPDLYCVAVVPSYGEPCNILYE